MRKMSASKTVKGFLNVDTNVSDCVESIVNTFTQVT